MGIERRTTAKVNKATKRGPAVIVFGSQFPSYHFFTRCPSYFRLWFSANIKDRLRPFLPQITLIWLFPRCVQDRRACFRQVRNVSVFFLFFFLSKSPHCAHLSGKIGVQITADIYFLIVLEGGGRTQHEASRIIVN